MTTTPATAPLTTAESLELIDEAIRQLESVRYAVTAGQAILIGPPSTASAHYSMTSVRSLLTGIELRVIWSWLRPDPCARLTRAP